MSEKRHCTESDLSNEEPGGWISWGEIDYSRWKITRTNDLHDTQDNITPLLRMIGTIAGTRPDWTSDELVWNTKVYSPILRDNSWPSKLPELFVAIGLVDVKVDNREFPPELLAFLLDTALMASEEMSYKALDPLGGGLGEKCRELISAVFQKRQKMAYNVGRLTVVAQVPK
jgi:hypothetical protein